MSSVKILYWNIAENRANMNQALYYTDEYDFLALQKIAVNRRTERAYCPLKAKYTAIYSGGKAALYIHKRWNEKTL
jgi:hypothetical protein